MTPPLGTDRTVAVLGAGTMGAGIAHVAAAAGHPVRLYDVDGEAVTAALEALAARLERSVEKGRLGAEDARRLVGRIVPAATLDELAGAALVVEAIAERLEVKQQVFAELEAIVGPQTILATNTSSLSVTAIAAGVERPDRVIGMHFFNPAPVMPLVEIVAGEETVPEVADLAAATVAGWGKSPVRCASTPGFIVNRVARPFYSEALRLLQEGVADMATIDAVVTGAGGFRMGPFTLMDLVGLDVNLAVSKSVYEQTFHDPRFAPNVLQQAKVDAGHLGRKRGRGWYRYAGGEPDRPPLRPVAPGPVPEAITAPGLMPQHEPLLERIAGAGIEVRRDDDLYHIAIGDVALFPTDGRPASMLVYVGSPPDRVVMDLALDWATATRVAVAVAPQAAPGTLGTAAGVLQAAGLEVVAVADSPGLILMRIVAQLIAVAADAALAGVAAPDDIDTAMRLGTNYPGGPFEWAERIGPGIVALVLDHLRWFYGEDRYRQAAALRHAVYRGHRLREMGAR